MLIRDYAELLLVLPMISVLVTLRFFFGDAIAKIFLILARVI
jgi:hypothetical protein